ncbi:hypothetical protein JCM6882_007944 [Rhodosporidiobolus microsporus]
MSTTKATNDNLRECAVCATRTSTRCSGCAEADVFFCSREHQKLLRPTHKWLCGKDPNIFTCAPLDEKESAALEKVKTELYEETAFGHPSQTLLQFLQSKGLFEGTWEDLKKQLLDEAQLVPEPQRSWALIHARNHLMHSSAGPKILNSAWRILSTDIMSLHALLIGLLPPSIRFLRDFNPYLRQKLVLTTLVQKFDGGGGAFFPGQRAGLSVDDVYLAQERLAPLVRELPIDEVAKAVISAGDAAGFSHLRERLTARSTVRRIGGV